MSWYDDDYDDEDFKEEFGTFHFESNTFTVGIIWLKLDILEKMKKILFLRNIEYILKEEEEKYDDENNCIIIKLSIDYLLDDFLKDMKMKFIKHDLTDGGDCIVYYYD